MQLLSIVFVATLCLLDQSVVFFFSTLLNFLFYHFITEKHFPLCFCFVVDFRLLSLSPVLLACLCSIANSLSPTSNQHSIFSKVDKTFSEKIEFLQVLSFVEWILQLTFLLLFVSCFVSAFHSIKNNLLFAFLLFFMFKIHERKRKRFTRNFRNDACAQFIRVTFQFFVLDNVSVQQPFWFRDTISIPFRTIKFEIDFHVWNRWKSDKHNFFWYWRIFDDFSDFVWYKY